MGATENQVFPSSSVNKNGMAASKLCRHLTDINTYAGNSPTADPLENFYKKIDKRTQEI